MARNRKKILPPEEIAAFFEQIAMMLQAGITLHDGIETLCSNQDGGYGLQYEVLLQALLESGSLSFALAASAIFPAYAVSMVRVGEKAGRLEKVALSLSAYYRREARLHNSIRDSVVYPGVLVLILAVVIGVLLISVLPVFQRVYAGIGVSGEAASLGAWVGGGVLIALGVIGLLAGAVALLLKTKQRDAVLSFFYSVFPPFRRASDALCASKFADVIAMMLASGYNIDSAIEFVPTVITDKRVLKRISRCMEFMRKGESFPQAVSSIRIFDELHEKMIGVGSASGQLDQVMRKLSVIYEEKADRYLQNIVGMIEPALVGLLCAAIGGILLTVMLPLLNMLSSMG